MPGNVPTFDELFASCSTAAHLELRDSYGLAGEAPQYAAWRAGELSGEEYGRRWGPFQESVAQAVARGTTFRRLRVVATPVSEYIRFEYAGTAATIKSGEDVRWLDRAQALDLLLPPNDLWLFDADAAVFLLFTGEGDYVEDVVVTDPGTVARAAAAFDAAWARAVPHAEFTV